MSIVLVACASFVFARHSQGDGRGACRSDSGKYTASLAGRVELIELDRGDGQTAPRPELSARGS